MVKIVQAGRLNLWTQYEQPGNTALSKQQLTTLWWKNKKIIIRVAVAAVLGVIVFVVPIAMAYTFHWDWTGFTSSQKTTTTTEVTQLSNAKKVTTTVEDQPAKTFWDWLQLLGVLAIPVMVGAGAAWFSYRQTLSASRLAEDQQREDAFQDYIDKISELLLKEKLGDLARKSRLTPGYEEARQIAQARTLAILPRLDRERKRSVLQFLYEVHLINLFDWSSADLTEAALNETTFIGANLSGAKLNGADLTGTDLSGVNLSEADLGGANLAGTNLHRANLSGAKLDGARLNGANLSEANLSGADLGNANLNKTMIWGTLSGRRWQTVEEYFKRERRMWKQVLDTTVKVKSVLDDFLSVNTVTIRFKNGTNLSGANLSKASLRGTDLSDANLERANLKEADLTQANLTRVNLKEANLVEAKMSRAKRTVVVIFLINLGRRVRIEHSKWDDLEKGYDSSPGWGVLSPREAKNLLKKSGGNKARLIAVGFKPFRLKVVKLEAETTNLQEADLTDADLTGVDLSGVNLYKAIVTPGQLGKAQSLKGTTLPNGTKHSW